MERKRQLRKFLIIFLLLIVSVYCFADGDSKDKRIKMINYAKEFIGVPYVYGGTDKTGTDCSGLIYTVARESIQLQLPRTVAALYGYAKIIPDNQKEPGDILFFKTVGDKVSHAGIYVGNNQFIHAASDGPNTGVILSSLNESYWKQHYYAVGQILPSTNAVIAGTFPNNNSSSSSSSGLGNIGSSGSFFSKVDCDVAVFYNWNCFTGNQFVLNSRGFSVQGNISYSRNVLSLGVGVELRYDQKLGVLQIPLTLSLGLSENLRFYAGPVLTLGDAVVPGKDKDIKPSFFPGIFGASWRSNTVSFSKIGLSLVQDISYTVHNAEDGATLPLKESLVSGLVFSSGVRVTFF